MIIEAVCKVVYNLLNALMVFALPSLPDSIMTILGQVSGYMVTGVSIMRSFFGDTAMNVMAICLGLILALVAAGVVWQVIIWVLRKIPFLHLS